MQPWNIPGNRRRYQLPDLTADSALTRIFVWNKERINFIALKGNQSPANYPPASVIDDWTYLNAPAAGRYVPSPGRAKVRLNLWISTSTAPANGQPIEVVITDFSYLPAAPGCKVELNKNAFVTGDAITVTNVVATNPRAGNLPIEYKFWANLPGGSTYSWMRGGADDSVSLPPGVMNNALGGPVTLATVTATFPPRGSYSINCRFLDPVSGKELAVETAPFTVQ